MEKYEVTWKNQIIEFELQRKKVKNINLNFRPDLTLMVSAGLDVPLEYIKDFVKAKGNWIQKKWSYFKNFQPETNVKEYISGESFKYLGRQVRLKVVEAPNEGVRYLRGYLYLVVKNRDDLKKKASLLNGWFRERSGDIFEEVFEKIYPVIAKYQIKKPELMIKNMKARWGSCVKDKGIVILNFELIKAPKYCIEYVILHELIHFLHHNHDAGFYSFLTALMPDWQIRKRMLDEEIVRQL